MVLYALLPVCSVMPMVNTASVPITRKEREFWNTIANGFCVSNTGFKKRNMHLITYSSAGHSIQLDYILYRKSFSNVVSNMKIIPNEECVKYHHQVVMCEFTTHIPCVKKCKFLTRIQTWKPRDPAIASQFQSAFKVKTMTAAAAVATAAGADADTAKCVESAWSKLKGPLLDAATEVCGLSKNYQWKSKNLVVWWTGGQSCTREACMILNALKKGGGW